MLGVRVRRKRDGFATEQGLSRDDTPAGAADDLQTPRLRPPRPGCSGSARQDGRRRLPRAAHQRLPRQRRRYAPGLGELHAAGRSLRLRAFSVQDKEAGRAASGLR